MKLIGGGGNNSIDRNVLFDPVTTFGNLNEEKMDEHLNHNKYKKITPWRALTDVIGIPIIMLVIVAAVKINFFLKIILILLITIHVIIATCLITYLSKNYNKNMDEDDGENKLKKLD